jgi:hypothetical protein
MGDLLKCCEDSGACQVCVESTELVSWNPESICVRDWKKGGGLWMVIK